MDISDERIDEIMQQMLDNTTEDGWCTIPEGLSDEEQRELYNRLAIAAMDDRIGETREALLNLFGYISDMEEHLDTYDLMELIKIKTATITNKENATDMLIDLHSSNKIEEFFNIEMVTDGSEESMKEAKEAKKELSTLIETKYKEDIDLLKQYCEKLIELSDKLIKRID